MASITAKGAASLRVRIAPRASLGLPKHVSALAVTRCLPIQTRFTNFTSQRLHEVTRAKIGEETKRGSVGGLSGLSKLLKARVRFLHLA